MRRELVGVGIFTGLYLVIATIPALITQNWEFVYYIAIVVLLAGAVLTIHFRVKLPTSLIWALSFWGLLHMLGGLLPVPSGFPVAGDKTVLYSLWIIPEYLKTDQLIHAYGFGVATWLCYRCLELMIPPEHRKIGILILSALAGMGLGAVNEVVEFIAVLVIPETNVGGYMNTGWDLVANGVGVTVAAVLLYKYNTRSHPGVAE